MKTIRNKEQYDKSLAEIERLVALDPEPGTPEADKLDILAVLVEDYEKKHFHIDLPDPIEAIKFRMEQQGLLQRDLVPYIGSKSKVSEVLSRKRPLTIQMIRALHDALGIPAKVLLQKPKDNRIICEKIDVDWNKFPIKEMLHRNWIKVKDYDISKTTQEIMNDFLSPIGGELPVTALCRRTKKEIDIYGLLAWVSHIVIRSKKECCPEKYKQGTVTKAFIKKVAQLSWFDKGPLLAQEFLGKNGIALIIEPQMPGTDVDGASLLINNKPIIGLTLRYDRIDSFWFTLIHELVHIAKHLKEHKEIFIDDLDTKFDDPKEIEADSLSSDLLVPDKIWLTSRAKLQKTPDAINKLAKDLNIHPAIIAGKIRYETNNYSLLTEMIGYGQVRKLFSNKE